MKLAPRYRDAVGFLLGAFLLSLASPAAARPYRAMVTRTAETTRSGNIELGARYQGFVLGAGGELRPIKPLPWHQLAASIRIGLVPGLEVETQLELLVEKQLLSTAIRFYPGDIPIGLQWTFVRGPTVALGVFLRGTVPLGPSDIDVLPPTLSDGTLDFEGTFIAELRMGHNARLMGNLGFLYHGVRDRGRLPDFDVPEAVRYDLALTANVTRRLLLALELVGRSFFDPQITPVWDDNQDLIEVIPGARFETGPGLVIEAALGIAASRDLRQMHLLRPLVGLTYEF